MSLHRNDPPLFHTGRKLYDHLQQAESELKRSIESYDGDRLLNTSVDDLINYFIEKFSGDPVSLREDDISTTEPRETSLETSRLPNGAFMYGNHQRAISATEFTFIVPYTGDVDLLAMEPSMWTSSPPQGTVLGNELYFRFVTTDSSGEEIRRAFDAELGKVRAYLNSANSMIEQFNRGIPSLITAEIERRRARLLSTKNMTASLGFPIRRRDGATNTYAVPNVRRKIRPNPPPASSAPYAPEPTLPTAEYEHILSVMGSMALVFERSPSAFKTMGEEHLRQQFLVQLNGHYEGSATGETFNALGKTDILIREQDKNIFIAECKFWTGPAGFSATIDQLLSYTTWRDTKTAIVVFSRDTALTTVLAKIPEGLKSHKHFKHMLPIDGETRYRAMFGNPLDANREVIITVLAFNVPK